MELWDLEDEVSHDEASSQQSTQLLGYHDPISSRLAKRARHNEPDACNVNKDTTVNRSTWVERLRKCLPVEELIEQLHSPVQLQTACSGTNAVSIAMKD